MVLIFVLMIIAYFIVRFTNKEKSRRAYYEKVFLGLGCSIIVSLLITLLVFNGCPNMWVKWRSEPGIRLLVWPDISDKYLVKQTVAYAPDNYIFLGEVDGKAKPIVVKSDTLRIFMNSSDSKLIKWVGSKRKLIFPVIFPCVDFEHERYDAYIPTIE